MDPLSEEEEEEEEEDENNDCEEVLAVVSSGKFFNIQEIKELISAIDVKLPSYIQSTLVKSVLL
jgi:hypothetical protein